MYKVGHDMIYGDSVLYKDDEKVETIKKINNSLTILHFLQEEREMSVEKMANILTKVSERGNDNSQSNHNYEKRYPIDPSF